MKIVVQELIDLTVCDREPIHIPCSIQPHGIMLVVDQEGLRVCYAAGDIQLRLGTADWQGRCLDELIGPALSAKVTALMQAVVR